jgi:hypothetical protein
MCLHTSFCNEKTLLLKLAVETADLAVFEEHSKHEFLILSGWGGFSNEIVLSSGFLFFLFFDFRKLIY